jgi:hypothetical protein
MSRAIYAQAAAAIACSAIGLAAQTNQPATSQTPPAAHVTVIGCVEPMSQAEAQASDSKYKLTHAKSRKTDSSQPGGTSGSASQGTTATTYRLDNGKNSTLAQDVGHQVEIVAVVEPSTAPVGTTGSNSTSASAPTATIDTIRVIATACPE